MLHKIPFHLAPVSSLCLFMVIVSQRIHLDFVVRVSFLVFRMWQMKYFHRQERPTCEDEGACFANRAKTFPKAFSTESYLWRELSLVWRKKYFTANFDTRTRTIWRYRSLSESTHPSRYVFLSFLPSFVSEANAVFHQCR